MTALALATAGLSAVAATGNADVTTVSQDTYRTGWDQNEPGLAPAGVASSDFA